MANKYYAVRKGLTPGIYFTWDECKRNVDGFSGAEYKSFKTIEDAKEYMGGKWLSAQDKKQNVAHAPAHTTHIKVNKTMETKATSYDNVSKRPGNAIVAYVDGSYNKGANTYGSGIVFIAGDEVTEFSILGRDSVMLKMWNVAGEVEAAMFAVRYAIQHKFDKITVYYDYNGISGWAGGWRANEPGAKRYKEFIVYAKNQISIEFKKVKAHSGNQYNDMADKLAKKACGII